MKNLFQSFSQSLETRFSKIDSQLSQVMTSQPSVSHIRQDVLTHDSFSALPAVAGLFQPPPDRAPSAPYSDGLGHNLGGLAAVRSPTCGNSFPRMTFSDLVVRVRDMENIHGFVPVAFLASLCGFTVFDTDHGFAVGGNSIADAIVSFRLCFFDPASPSPGSSRDGVIFHLCSLFGVAVPSPAPLVGSSVARSLRGECWLRPLSPQWSPRRLIGLLPLCRLLMGLVSPLLSPLVSLPLSPLVSLFVSQRWFLLTYPLLVISLLCFLLLLLLLLFLLLFLFLLLCLLPFLRLLFLVLPSLVFLLFLFLIIRLFPLLLSLPLLLLGFPQLLGLYLQWCLLRSFGLLSYRPVTRLRRSLLWVTAKATVFNYFFLKSTLKSDQFDV